MTLITAIGITNDKHLAPIANFSEIKLVVNRVISHTREEANCPVKQQRIIAGQWILETPKTPIP